MVRSIQAFECEHKKLASWTDSLTAQRCHQCMGCGNQIIIPKGTSPENEDEIICLAFGQRWRGRAYQDYGPRVFQFPIL